MDSNHRSSPRDGVALAAGPQDHLCIAVDPLGVAPRFPACDAGVFLLDDEPDTVWKVRVGDPSLRHAPKDSNPDQLGWNQSCCQLHQGRVIISGRRGTRTPKRLAPPPVFKTGSSSGRMPSTSSCCGRACVAVRTRRIGPGCGIPRTPRKSSGGWNRTRAPIGRRPDWSSWFRARRHYQQQLPRIIAPAGHAQVPTSSGRRT